MSDGRELRHARGMHEGGIETVNFSGVLVNAS